MTRAGPIAWIGGVLAPSFALSLTLSLALGTLPVGAEAPPAAVPSPTGTMEARLWLDRGDEPVLQRGDEVRIYFRSSHDAWVALFHIDTHGSVRLLFPSEPGAPEWVRGGMDYRLLLAESPTWRVNEDPGTGYFFLLTSAEPLDYSLFDYSARAGGWDLSPVARSVYADPYVAMDDFVEAVLPSWEWADFDLAVVSYHVGQSYSYPRFLCYDCHTARPYREWNPYHHACTSFRVVIHNDPLFYPVARYGGTRVVTTRPPLSRVPRFDFKERARGEPGTPVVRSVAPQPRQAAPATRGGDRLPAVIRGRPSGQDRSPPPAAGARTPAASDRPVLQRRPPRAGQGGSGPPARTPRPSPPPRGGGGGG